MPHSHIAQELSTHGICVIPDFLESADLKTVQSEFHELYLKKKFQPAGIGQGRGHAIETEIRRNELLWIDPSALSQPQKILALAIEKLKLSLNRTLFLGLQDWEGHYARYPEGGFYDRHRDAFQGDDRRVVSLILYLNDDWKKTDGGELRIYAPEGPQDIPPRGGSLVCFLSQEMEHEVRVTQVPRLSFTAWLRRGPN